jgi:hypothetical protein
MKDHEIAQTVNQLRDIAREYGQTQQLRERIAAVVVPLLSGRQPAAIANQCTCKGVLGHSRQCAMFDESMMRIAAPLANEASKPAPSVEQEERGACGPFKCEAAQRDGVLCSDDECDIATGARAASTSANVAQGAGLTDEQISRNGDLYGSYSAADGYWSFSPKEFIDCVRALLSDQAVNVAQGAEAVTSLRRIAHELHTYNPAADEYKGEHIHKVWAREIEALLPAASNGEPK